MKCNGKCTQAETDRGPATTIVNHLSQTKKVLLGTVQSKPVTQPAASTQGKYKQAARKKKKKQETGLTVSNSNNNLNSGMCFYVSHHLYLELYEFSTIHATKMLKGIFFSLPSCTGCGHEQRHRCLRSHVTLSRKRN